MAASGLPNVCSLMSVIPKESLVSSGCVAIEEEGTNLLEQVSTGTPPTSPSGLQRSSQVRTLVRHCMSNGSSG
jgi:hypothetical protein